jgi:hypothetical protein
MPGTSGRRRRRETSIDVVRVRVLPDGRLDRRNAASYLGRSPKTLAQWALQGKGPPPHKDNVSGRVFYYLDELDACIAGNDGDREPAGGGEDSVEITARRGPRRDMHLPPGPSPPPAR